MLVGRFFATAAAVIAASLVSGAAFAQAPAETAPPLPQASADDDDETPGPGRPLPRDDRTGRFSAHAGATIVVPAGDLGSGVTLGQIANAGPGGELGLAIGVSRHSALELRGQFVQLGPSSECPDCRTQMFGGTLGLVYHTSQALAFDPWVRFGAGYRAIVVRGDLASVVTTAPPPGTFHTVDVASLSLGGDFFPVPWFGIGVYLEGDVGINVAGPSADARGAVYGLFQAGLRIALEPQRKAVTAASRPAPRVAAASPRAASTPTPAAASVVDPSDLPSGLYNRGAR